MGNTDLTQPIGVLDERNSGATFPGAREFGGFIRLKAENQVSALLNFDL